MGSFLNQSPLWDPFYKGAYYFGDLEMDTN